MGKPTGPDISIIVKTNDHIVASIQGAGYCSQKVGIKKSARIRRGSGKGLEVSQVLVPNRAQISRIPTGPVGRKEGNSGAMLAFQLDEGPSAKT